MSAEHESVPRGSVDATALLAAVLESTDEIAFLTDAQRRIVACYGPIERILGMSSDALMGAEPTEFLHPADIDWRDRVRTQLEQTGQAGGQARVRRGDMAYAWMDTRLRAVPGQGVLLVLRLADGQLEPDLAVRVDPHVLLEAVRDEDGVLTDMRCVGANDAAAAALGAPRASLLGARIAEALSAHDAANVVEWCRLAIAGGDIALDDETWAGPRGDESRYLEVRGVAFGERVSLTWRDVTERHEAAVALAEREAAYRLIADNATDVIIRSAHGRIEWVSPSITEVLGWTPDEIVGQRVPDLMHPDDLAAVRHVQMETFAAGGTEGRAVARFRTASHEWRWMSDHGRAIMDDQDRIIGGIDSLRDIQLEHEATAALAQREQELRGIIDSLHDPWVLLQALRDESGQIVDFVFIDANEAACEHNHATREEMIGARLLVLLPEHRTSGIFDRYVGVVESGEPLADDDEPFTNPFDGSVRWFDNRAVKVGDGISLTWRDVTERYENRLTLARQAEQDILTGVANRRQLERRMWEILNRLPRTGDRVAVMYCDLDHFKEINDTLGHAAGDEVLTVVASRIRKVVREGDVVARLGGDEFVVILDGIRGVRDAEVVAGKVLTAIRVPVTVGGLPIEPRMSVGLAIAQPGEDPTHVLARADDALYLAKRDGRDRVVVARAEDAAAD